MALVVARGDVQATIAALALEGAQAFEIGAIVERAPGEPQTVVV
jgi:hypothetical protein